MKICSFVLGLSLMAFSVQGQKEKDIAKNWFPIYDFMPVNFRSLHRNLALLLAGGGLGMM